MQLSIVVALSGILLFFRLFSLVFYYKITARVSAATLWNNRLVQNQSMHKVHVDTKIWQCAYYSDD